ncbi:hypothetical protein PYW07_017405 [Mythimna separata]|uniref:Globin domain-containing protein n=1 Tax=Mythimna separata TaxID=271217 RepID=A0AAD8DXD6_MYTSE|nr:hypothetical protein PYW07_017405 [Mythimna separata]
MLDPLECPFREFRDNELQSDGWGLSTAAFKALQHNQQVKAVGKTSHDSGQRSGASSMSPKSVITSHWIDDQTQPLPRSVRQYLHGWIRAEDLALDRWGAELAIFEENEQMSVVDVQLCHAQVLYRSSFCRNVLSACFILERVDLIVEHQWELFSCVLAPEGWRAKYHIYSPGLKSGGGQQHKPTLSRNGCYLVRLFFLGAWRCVWVNDQVPVDTSGSPLLPFSPLLTHPPPKPGSTRIPPPVSAGVIYLWPLLLTKALLKLAAPDMNSDEDDSDNVEDEPMEGFDIMHALTGSVNIRYYIKESTTSEDLWTLITSEVPVFSWYEEEDGSTIRTRSTKKPTAKELASVIKRPYGMTYGVLKDTKELPPYHLPGITPGHEQILLITMARDLPLKKPLPEPEVALWKYYRWVDWAKRHGLYEAYECPRTKYVKVKGLLKSSYAPHLLDVQSTESITFGFIEEHVKSNPKDDDDDYPNKKKKKDVTKSVMQQQLVQTQQVKAEMREWIQYLTFFPLLGCIHVVYHPSQYNYVSAGSCPPNRVTAKAPSKLADVVAPKNSPLYLQLDGPETNTLRMCFTVIHPRILLNSGSPVNDYIESGHLVLEKFEWFKDTKLPNQQGFMSTREYNSLEIDLEPGRHYFRIWTHYRIHWHMMLISESSLLLGTRDIILAAAVRECPWVSRFLLNLQAAFLNWTKTSRTSPAVALAADREFFRSYLPDLTWNNEEVGYDRHLLHWMFRQALQSLLLKTMNPTELKIVTHVLRKYFCDPDFGFPKKPKPPRSLREIADLDICDCVMPEIEEVELMEEQLPEVLDQSEPGGETEAKEEKPLVPPEVMTKLLKVPVPPVVSQLCELATSEVHCAILREEREKTIRRHEAAIVLQSYWRGTWARKVLSGNTVCTPDVTKVLMDRAFGSLDSLSMLMNQFFRVYPGTKRAYSISSALSGVYGLQQHTGTTPVTYKCQWIPHFQGVFYCHTPVKVHFDVQSNIPHNTVEVYNNDTEHQLPQVYNSHITFDFAPNIFGYTVLGHGTLARASGTSFDAHWQLTVMSSLSGAFHLCDNEETCKELPMPQSIKLHVDEIFVPNRRNILGGIQIAVTKHEAISFRAAASSRDLKMVATLRTMLSSGLTEELGTCSGKGEIYWPYIRLEPSSGKSQTHVSARDLFLPSRSLLRTRGQKGQHHPKNRSGSKMGLIPSDTKMYTIEVTCPEGWPLTLEQWKRVDEVRNTIEELNVLQVPKKGNPKEREFKSVTKPIKPASAKEKIEKPPTPTPMGQQPIPGDAYVELECALSAGTGAIAKRDDERDQVFARERKSWASVEPGRNHKGAQIRKDFRNEFLVAPPPPSGHTPTDTDESTHSGSISTRVIDEAAMFEPTEEGTDVKETDSIQRPTPASEAEMVEMTVEMEEEALYLTMPDQLRDKFIPLDFLPLCMKEGNEDEKSVLVTMDMAEAARKDRHARIAASNDRMRELQVFNEEHVIGRQRNRCKRLEKLFVDAQFDPEILEVMEEKEEAVAQEVLLRNLSATKKKLEAKKK